MQYAKSGFSGHRRIFLACAIIAIALHALVLFCWDSDPRAAEILDVAEGAVEVELFEGPSAVEPAPPDEQAERIEEISQHVPEPPPQEVPSEMPILPAPEPTPEPSEITVSQQVEQPSPPKPTKHPSSSRSASASPAIRPHSSSVGVVGESTGRLLGKPAYIVKPAAAYPTESRSSGEEGTVVLRITIDATGRPKNIRVLISSGFPRLDRSAVEGAWRCRIRNATAGDQFDAPLLFRLQNPR